MQFQKLLEQNLEILKGMPACGCSEAEIYALEAEIGRTFPQSYREFLSLAGDHFPYNYGGVSELEYLRNMQIALKQQLSENGFTLPKESWAFSALDFEQFHLFYWDEGDDPVVYLCMPCYVSDGMPLIEKNTESFTAFVERAVHYFAESERIREKLSSSEYPGLRGMRSWFVKLWRSIISKII